MSLPTGSQIKQFYNRLLGVLRREVVRQGDWQLLECAPAWDGNWTSDCYVVFAWQGAGDERLVVAVNYAPNRSQCRIRLPFTDLRGRQWRLADLLGGAAYDRDGNELQERGLYLDEPAWSAQVFALTPAAKHRETPRGDVRQTIYSPRRCSQQLGPRSARAKFL